MIDQKKTGQFISDIRKEKGLTQKQLADEIGVSDKAISRWETGRGMPDTSIMADLCKVLDISINELLSGQRLSSVDYNGKAEENMVELIKTNENVKRQGRNAVIGTVVGIVLLCLFIWRSWDDNLLHRSSILNLTAWDSAYYTWCFRSFCRVF